VTVPVTLPVAPANCPVPSVTCQLSCEVPLNRQLCGLTENEMGTVANTVVPVDVSPPPDLRAPLA
jgi:hypothetical protein